MNHKILGGVLMVLGMCAVIGFAVWTTQSSGPLWALFLVLWFSRDYSWGRENSS